MTEARISELAIRLAQVGACFCKSDACPTTRGAKALLREIVAEVEREAAPVVVLAAAGEPPPILGKPPRRP